ncbi:hypothetical protein ERO13_D07G100101v2 [Gossypium hirsutum]|uniref:Uncharacterized protein n=1 Tax=Gossypium darwinii TaxID=34276 RepID=A0A5D2BYV3_GOSDA|nr:hypothetical protein ERO13_D07G100101v2 [Gossypium hirsutum]TYG60992.1 hypothetical protein ES288_D07G112300v1 [Gossypium darwinii]
MVKVAIASFYWVKKVVSDRGTLDLAPLLDDNNSEGMMLSKQANNSTRSNDPRARKKCSMREDPQQNHPWPRGMF